MPLNKFSNSVYAFLKFEIYVFHYVLKFCGATHPNSQLEENFQQILFSFFFYKQLWMIRIFLINWMRSFHTCGRKRLIASFWPRINMYLVCISIAYLQADLLRLERISIYFAIKALLSPKYSLNILIQFYRICQLPFRHTLSTLQT